MLTPEILEKIKPGARVKVFEGTTPFEGLVISRKHGNEAGGTFKVRSVVAGVGVEKVFPVNSPVLSKATVISSPKKIHRSKLYFVRKVSGKTIRKKLGVSV